MNNVLSGPTLIHGCGGSTLDRRDRRPLGLEVGRTNKCRGYRYEPSREETMVKETKVAERSVFPLRTIRDIRAAVLEQKAGLAGMAVGELPSTATPIAIDQAVMQIAELR